MRKYLLVFLLLSVFNACTNKSDYTAQEIIDLAIEKSGVDQLKHSDLSFEFRDIQYKAIRNHGSFQLLRTFIQDNRTVEDLLSNDGFQRKIEGKIVNLVDSIKVKYSESVNSVHYFSILPFGLNDGAVIKKLLPSELVKGKEYYKVEISFQQDGGGVDYEDVFIYWFEKEQFQLEYLAYKFQVNGGGMRFRAVSKEQRVKGVRLLDYKNFKPKNTNVSLTDLAKMYEQNQLIEASNIELKKIQISLY